MISKSFLFLSSTKRQIIKSQSEIPRDLQYKTLPHSTVSLTVKTLLLQLTSYATSWSEIRPKSSGSISSFSLFHIFIFSQTAKIFQSKQMIELEISQDTSSSCEVLKMFLHLQYIHPAKPQISFTIWMSMDLSQLHLFTLIFRCGNKKNKLTDEFIINKLTCTHNYLHRARCKSNIHLSDKYYYDHKSRVQIFMAFKNKQTKYLYFESLCFSFTIWLG